MTHSLTLVSHALCPYVQRIAIALAEKQVAHDRLTIDLSQKPKWFHQISPLGRTPVLKAGQAALFESAAILEYLEEVLPHPLLPADPVERARHRAWIGFSSECLNDIAGLYSTTDAERFAHLAAGLNARFRILEAQLGPGPWFAGEVFGLVDAVFAPVFRYFDVFDMIGDFGVFDGLAKVSAWRRSLATRPSVRDAVAPDYPQALFDFLIRKGGVLIRNLPMACAIVTNCA